ncbi:MAG: hypothetical protein WC526_03615 [Patescibacteria group bacterium]
MENLDNRIPVIDLEDKTTQVELEKEMVAQAIHEALRFGKPVADLQNFENIEEVSEKVKSVFIYQDHEDYLADHQEIPLDEDLRDNKNLVWVTVSEKTMISSMLVPIKVTYFIDKQGIESTKDFIKQFKNNNKESEVKGVEAYFYSVDIRGDIN